MRTTCLLAAALWLAGIASAQAQRRIRIGPTYSSLSLEDQSGSSYSFPSYGGSVALLTGDESETGLTIARYNNLSTDHGIRRLTLYGLDSTTIRWAHAVSSHPSRSRPSAWRGSQKSTRSACSLSSPATPPPRRPASSRSPSDSASG